MKFKVGDRVRGNALSKYGITREGWEGTVVEVKEEYFTAEGPNLCGLTYRYTELYPACFDLISTTAITKIKTMTLIEKFKLAAKTEPEKTFIKAGVTTMDGSLTTEGRDLFLGYLLKKNGDDFKATVIDPIVAEAEAEEKE